MNHKGTFERLKVRSLGSTKGGTTSGINKSKKTISPGCSFYWLNLISRFVQSPWTMQREMKVPRKKPSLTKSEKMTKRYDNVDIRLHQARSLANRTRTAVSPRYCAHPGQLFRPCYASSVWHNRQYRGIYNVRQITRSRAEDMPNKIESTKWLQRSA